MSIKKIIICMVFAVFIFILLSAVQEPERFFGRWLSNDTGKKKVPEKAIKSAILSFNLNFPSIYEEKTMKLPASDEVIGKILRETEFISNKHLIVPVRLIALRFENIIQTGNNFSVNTTEIWQMNDNQQQKGRFSYTIKTIKNEFVITGWEPLR